MVSKFELRAPTRSALNMYNSYQKVYKLRLDENRSHAKTIDIANLSSKQPNLTAAKPKLERSLGKIKTSFFQPSIFKNELPLSFNILYDSFNSLNYYFFDYPFLLGLKSDPSRYYWTDWFARWGMVEVQPSSSARYSITGVPFFNKNFDFSGETNGTFVDSENYFTRILRARRNYLPNWTHTPYVYTKNSFFATSNAFFDAFNFKTKKIVCFKNYLSLSHWYWKNVSVDSSSTNLFIPTHSGIHTYGRSSWTSKSSITTYYTMLSIFFDTLTKREFFYREFLGSKKKTYRIESFMTNGPTNPIINDIKAALLFANPTSFNTEYSREAYYSSLELFNSTHLKPELYVLFSTLGLPTYFIEVFLNHQKPDSKTDLYVTNEATKSQYKPMRRGILNMIRLHGTGAVAMPIEIRLQVLASSKDVIHSWAIPSAGVKIDCVPGYSSHRVIIFLVSGIFWGQCMEVCGRYHHWMPVIVYFMKRDLFFLWCTHFVFLSGSNNMWVINDRQNTHYGRTVSFSKNSWIHELK